MSDGHDAPGTAVKTRIQRRFAELRRAGRKGLITYIAAGDPDLATTGRLVRAMAEAGADVIELGVPFSDPQADGPVIQAASQRALNGGVKVNGILSLVQELRAGGLHVPICLMTYYNPIFHRGVGIFARQAAAAGVDGLIVPDLPMEESDDLLAACRQERLDLVPFLAPTSTPDRMRMAGELATGFIYCVSLTGVTGARQRLSDRVAPMLAEIRRHTGATLAVGFGISGPEQAAEAARVADAVIVGSALVSLCARDLAPDALVAALAELTAALRQGVDSAQAGPA